MAKMRKYAGDVDEGWGAAGTDTSVDPDISDYSTGEFSLGRVGPKLDEAPVVVAPPVNTPVDTSRVEVREPANSGGERGYIEGIGETIAPGSSITPAQRDNYLSDALGQGVPQDWINAFLGDRNPNDYNRITEAYFSDANKEDTRTGAPDIRDPDLDRRNGDIYSGAQPISGGGGGSTEAQPVAPTTPTPAAGPPPAAPPPAAPPRDIRGMLQSLWDSGGGMNQDIITARTSNARDDMERTRKSQMATNNAYLASRGLLGSGPEITSSSRLNERLGDTYGNAVTDIWADEAGNADDRMMKALSLSADITIEDAKRVLDQFKADTERTSVEGGLANQRLGIDNQFTLGQGSLALGNLNAANDYSLGLGNLGLGRDTLLHQMDNSDLDRLVELIGLMQSGANTAAGGFN